jgi:hypothetical protein
MISSNIAMARLYWLQCMYKSEGKYSESEFTYYRLVTIDFSFT